MGENITARDLTLNTTEASLQINRTALNKQYFKINYAKDLEFLNLESTKFYMRKQGPKHVALDVPEINDYETYHQFRGQVPSNLLAEAEP